MEPKYIQIKEDLMKIINKLEGNTRFPSERTISEIVDASRMTVRKAIEELVKDGYLYRNGNLGTYVSKIGHRKYINSVHGFTKEVILSGGVPSNKVVSLDHYPADEFIAEKLSVEVAAPVVKVVRLRLKDDEPMMVDTSYFPVDIIGNLTKEICQGSLYKYFAEDVKIKLSNSVQEFTAVLPNQEVADLLEMDVHQPVIRVEHKTFLDTGDTIEYAVGYKNSEKYQLVIKATIS